MVVKSNTLAGVHFWFSHNLFSVLRVLMKLTSVKVAPPACRSTTLPKPVNQGASGKVEKATQQQTTTLSPWLPRTCNKICKAWLGICLADYW